MDPLKRQLLDHFQRDFPVCERPYAELARRLNVSEQQVIDSLAELQANDFISRVGPVFNHHKAGASTLAAIAVPEDQLEQAAAIINRFDEVNHNYAREHYYNLWFVVTAGDELQLQRTLNNIASAVGKNLLNLPMKRAFHIDLSFKLDWQEENSCVNSRAV
jgi:DNA-binding Lrp family transcriptional regulator